MIPLQPKLNNYLWIGRTRLGLTRKRLAGLIGHETTSQLSRWEAGSQCPSLANALMLGYVLERPVEDIFFMLREEMIREVDRQRKAATEDEDVGGRGDRASVARSHGAGLSAHRVREK